MLSAMPGSTEAAGAPAVPVGTAGWLNRSTVGVSLASFFSDVSHELATAVLPVVLLSLHAGAGALGIIEGSADGLSAVAKLWGGLEADRVRRRKPLAAIGYLVTAVGTAAIGFCAQGWQVLLCRVSAWIGRGSRSASRDVLMSDAAHPAAQGKAFGMERAADAAGAVTGPLLALLLISLGTEARHVMRWSLLPGILAFLSITLLVVERPHRPPERPRTFQASLAGTGPAFRRYLAGILVFGSGDFSRTLLILYATQHVQGSLFTLGGATLAISLYVLHNAVSALAAFPLGALTDRVGRRPVLVAGYVFAAATTFGFAFAPPVPVALLALFVCSGLYIACEEVAEKAYAAELLPKEVKGTGMGVLAAVNGAGDMISSAVVGGLWSLYPGRPVYGFVVAASTQLLGAAVIGSARPAAGMAETDPA
jgi:MFS family permease